MFLSLMKVWTKWKPILTCSTMIIFNKMRLKMIQMNLKIKMLLISSTKAMKILFWMINIFLCILISLKWRMRRVITALFPIQNSLMSSRILLFWKKKIHSFKYFPKWKITLQNQLILTIKVKFTKIKYTKQLFRK